MEGGYSASRHALFIIELFGEVNCAVFVPQTDGPSEQNGHRLVRSEEEPEYPSPHFALDGI